MIRPSVSLSASFIPALRHSQIVVALLLMHVHSTQGQPASPIGTPEHLDVATWNIEWFGDGMRAPNDDALQFENVRRILESAQIDVWAVQEIASSRTFERLLDSLGAPYEGRLATQSGSQRIGYIYNSDVIRVRQVRHILTDAAFEFASRPPLRMDVDVLLPDTTVTVSFITLHMKAFGDASSYNRRVDASRKLKTHIDFTSLSSKNVIVLGDFNDGLVRSTFAGRPSPYDNFIQDPDRYAFLTMPLEQGGQGSFCTNASCSFTGSLFDHILISNELIAASGMDRPALVLDQLADAVTLFGQTTSDHLPVFARFTFTPSPVAVEAAPEISATDVALLYPNPAISHTTVAYHLHQPDHVRVALYDSNGRQLEVFVDAVQGAGHHETQIDLQALASGGYFVTVALDHYMRTLPVFVIR